ncbi:nucleotidyl transferase AbiEii/AbiGii toxin family protein [Streptomyces sp. NPDC049954]|uniref:nucleotidyl transferase AbiEii/AbiGii toxin family protein n=1 Tax=Streptomyces sp. NPDC049954 TaxID=3155779 RepID=UPI0034466ED7
MPPPAPFRAWHPHDERLLTTPEQHTLHSAGALLTAVREALAPGTWYLKGSAALLAWSGPGARLPEDVDLAVETEAAGPLLKAGELPARTPRTRVRILRAEPMAFHRADRPPVHRSLARVEAPGLSVEVLLNLALVPRGTTAADARTGPLFFPGGPSATGVPAATFGRCLAQKLLRYTLRRSGGRIGTRWTDLLDFVLCASSDRAPRLRLASLRTEVAAELEVVGRPWPELSEPPPEWLDFWDSAMFRHRLPYGRLPEAARSAEAFWEPVLARHPAGRGTEADAVWDPAAWTWSPH